MITKYKAELGYFDGLVTVQCTRETAKSVFFEIEGWRCGTEERREIKECRNHRYFDSWDDAKACLIERAERNVAGAEKRLEYRRAQLEKAKAITREPKG